MEGTTNYEITANGYDVVVTASDDVYRIFIPEHYALYEDGKLQHILQHEPHTQLQADVKL